MSDTRKWVLLAAAVVLGGCATASGSHLDYAAPARGYEPWVPVAVSYVPPDQLGDTCGLDPTRLVGCSKLWPGERCEIYVAEGLGAQLTREVLAHERAHCGGWRHDE